MRKIIHIDCDCFFAAVEMRDNPALANIPIAVGGSASGRGVLSTCNYEARKFGLHSAMPTAEALRLCPHVTLLPHRFEAYREASAQVKEIFARYTDLIEPLSLDEAFLDVTEENHCKGSATLMAIEICQAIEREVGITASAGIAPNKFLAKIASDWNKPNGYFLIKPEEVDAFVKNLEVKKIPGVGKSTMKKMQSLEIKTCGDLQKVELLILVKRFGAFGKRLHDLSRGIDHRSVKSTRVRKSISVENTYSRDLPDYDACLQALPGLIEKFEARYEKIHEKNSVRKIFVKIKFSDFSTTTAERTATEISGSLLENLLHEAWQRKAMPVRLIGVGAGVQQHSETPQLDLFVT